MMAPIPHMKPRLVQSFRRLGAHLWPPWQLAVAWEPAVRRLNEGGTAGANGATGRKAELSEAAASSSQTVPLYSPIVLHVQCACHHVRQILEDRDQFLMSPFPLGGYRSGSVAGSDFWRIDSRTE